MENFDRLKDTTLQSLETKLNKLTNVVKDPDRYNSGLASDSRVSKIEDRVGELDANSHAPVDFDSKLNLLHSKIDTMSDQLNQMSNDIQSILNYVRIINDK